MKHREGRDYTAVRYPNIDSRGARGDIGQGSGLLGRCFIENHSAGR
jgi:hypothetical protein